MAPKSVPPPIEDRIERHYARLPKSEQRVADLILDFPGDIAGYSATELAALSGGSKAAVTRLIKRLGFENYNEARRIARDVQRWGSPLYLHSKKSGPAATGSPLDAQLTHDRQILADTLANLRSAPLDKIVDAIVSAKHIWLLGFRNNHIMAAYFRWQLIQVRGGVHLLPRGGETFAEYLANLSDRDLLIVLGIRRRPRALGRIMHAARERRVPVLYVTDPTAVQSTQYATWTLRCHVRSASLFDSYVGVISVLHFLSSAAVERAGPAGRAQLKRIEKLHETLEEFD